MGRWVTKGVILVGLLALNGCNKTYTPADFMKDDALRSKTLTQCAQQNDQLSKNCLNAQEAKRKIDFEKQTGRTDIK
ncbi:EexN family lipoprotein [Rosenbergiella nectarea]|nr:EexN family lipoprotein [Rosenbergiella nectarea]MBT0730094.1 EexN family lipoprotein [Rosenbergiella nectarea subsp. apis]